MKKEKARSHISAYLEKHIKELKIELEDKIKSSVLQCSDVNDIDSHSHQFQVLKDEKSVVPEKVAEAQKPLEEKIQALQDQIKEKERMTSQAVAHAKDSLEKEVGRLKNTLKEVKSSIPTQVAKAKSPLKDKIKE